MQYVQKLRNETKSPPKSQMHKAANYFLNEWDGIEAISHYGDVEWDNNLLERINLTSPCPVTTHFSSAVTKEPNADASSTRWPVPAGATASTSSITSPMS